MRSLNFMRAAGIIIAACAALNAAAQSTDSNATSMETNSAASKNTDHRLAGEVRHALARSQNLDPTHIYVKVVDGAVTLTGSAISQNQIELAGSVAKSIGGVTSVVNGLSLRQPGREAE